MVVLKRERVELARVLAEVEGPIGQTINHHVELCAAAIGQVRKVSELPGVSGAGMGGEGGL